MVVAAILSPLQKGAWSPSGDLGGTCERWDKVTSDHPQPGRLPVTLACQKACHETQVDQSLGCIGDQHQCASPIMATALWKTVFWSRRGQNRKER